MTAFDQLFLMVPKNRLLIHTGLAGDRRKLCLEQLLTGVQLGAPSYGKRCCRVQDMLGLLVHLSFDIGHGAGYTDGTKRGKLGSEFTPSHWEMEMI